MAKPRLLVTRFAPDGQDLTNQLLEQGIFSLAQPLLEIQTAADFYNADCIFNKHYDYIIAVSRHAVDYTNRALSTKTAWPISHYIAVGASTQFALEKVCKQPVEVPKNSSDSEGLLALPSLLNMHHKSVLILRGVGGRELIKDVLTARRASVEYYEPYQRIAVKLSAQACIDKWQQHEINGAIISSVELLEQLVKLINDVDPHWLKQLRIFAASQRILNHALLLGFQHRLLLPGMSNKQIIDYFTDEGGYDRD